MATLHHACARIGKKVAAPLPSPPVYSMSSVAELIERIDAALRSRHSG